MPDLSIVIPARNEEWLARTVADILEHREADTEVIVVLDGAWPPVPLPVNERVQVVYLPASIGQRAATNLGVRLSEATYVMKCDGHVAFAQGFDRVLIEAARELGDDVTQIPAQKNLHIYDRVCPCGRREYQGPMTAPCVACGKVDWTQEIVWQPKRGSTTTAWCFDAEPKFQYWGAAKHAQTDDICDVMTSLGACVFMSRARFWAIGGLDESYGSWGSFGIEIACKSWLSGGRQVVNRRTWFAHFFRVGGIGFPYPISGRDQDAARARARQVWFENAWPGQVRPLRWLLEKFWPVPGWTQAQLDALPGSARPRTKGIVYYSDCRGDASMLSAVREQLARVAPGPIVSVTLSPVAFGRNVVLALERGYLTMFRQILAGLEALDTDVAFLCEHDVLYDRSHFAFTPQRADVYYYNQNTWKVDAASGHALHYRCSQTSGLCADRQLLLEHYRKRIAIVERDGFSRRIGFEPGTHNRPERVDDLQAETWMSSVPNIDIRHGHNLTPSRWRRDQFKNQRFCEGWEESDRVPGWGITEGRFADFLQEVCSAQQAVA